MGYFAFHQSFPGKKIVRIHDTMTEITIGVTGSGYDEWYRYPASFLIPDEDPQCNKEGNTAMGTYGYMLNSRTWVYDIGLALLVFVTAKEWDIVDELLHRLAIDQNMDGSWNFSYDIYIGKLFHDYVRTGAMGWVVWGACYALLQHDDWGTNKELYYSMLSQAGMWFLNHQIKDVMDPRYGLLTGGYGVYDNDYNYTPTEIEWCSTEHNCSAMQALIGLSLVLDDPQYCEAAQMVKTALFTKLYDWKNNRFYQGINGGKIDTAWALDCTTWAGKLLLSITTGLLPDKCMQTTIDTYYTTNKTIEVSTLKERFNVRYTSDHIFHGFKPYSDKTPDYAGAPDIVWSEGTLGAIALALYTEHFDLAKDWMDEMIELQNCTNCTGGILYVTATYGEMPWEFHAWESCVSSCWLYLLVYNPDVLFPISLKYMDIFTETYEFDYLGIGSAIQIANKKEDNI